MQKSDSLSIDFSVKMEDLILFNLRILQKRGFVGAAGILALLIAIQLISFVSSHDIMAFVGGVLVATLAVGCFVVAVRNPFRALLSAVIISLVLILLIVLGNGDISTGFIVSLPILLLGTFGYTLRFALQSYYLGDNDMLGPQHLDIDNAGIKGKSEVSESFFKWAAVTDIEQDEKLIYIFIGKLKAHIIPKTTFATQDASNSFYNSVCDIYSRQNAK